MRKPSSTEVAIKAKLCGRWRQSILSTIATGDASSKCDGAVPSGGKVPPQRICYLIRRRDVRQMASGWNPR